jgi:hypothetical protein
MEELPKMSAEQSHVEMLLVDYTLDRGAAIRLSCHFRGIVGERGTA